MKNLWGHLTLFTVLSVSTFLGLDTFAGADDFFHVNTEQRLALLAQAKLFIPFDLSGPEFLNAGEGSPIAKFIPNDSVVECTYKKKAISGTTGKFNCVVNSVLDASGKKIEVKSQSVKVRYGGVKPYTMVLATHLAWALGFGSDTETPVKKVICHGCSRDPFHDEGAQDETETFTEVSVEAPFPGTEIYEEGSRYSKDEDKPTSAWYWSELPKTAEGDALRLFAVLLKHNDNKAIQNRLICQSVENGECKNPFLYVHDFGNTFGSDGIKIHPLSFKKWSYERVWKYSDACVGQLQMNWFNGDGMSYPEISEAGRKLLADRLSALLAQPKQLHDIFAAAHLENYDDEGEHYTTDDWLTEFILKAHEIIDRTCPH